VSRFDCFSIWRRRTAKKRQQTVIDTLRHISGIKEFNSDSKMARAFDTAADILEKIADKYEQTGDDI